MKRYLFLTIVILLVQVLSICLAKGIQWWMRPFWQIKLSYAVLFCVLLSNAFLMGFYFHNVRYPMGYLALLWLSLLSAVCSAVIILAVSHLNIGIDKVLINRAISFASLIGFVGMAVYNAYVPVVRHIDIQLDKPMAVPIRLAVASDLHLGALVGNRQLQKLGQILSDEKVDILLMPGDIMDDDTSVFESDKMADNFAKMINTPKFGTIASLGNHDLYKVDAYDSINDAIYHAKARLLKDQIGVMDIVKDNQSVTLQFIGRYDDHKADRLSTDAFMADINHNLPVILLDHRPSQIASNAKLPIDLQVSGHTHKGQVFPANFIVDRLNVVGYGYQKINDMNVVVSSGFGFWGVPFRLGSQSEVWVIDLVGK